MKEGVVRVMKIQKQLIVTAAVITAAAVWAVFSQSASAQTYAGPGPVSVFTDDLENGSTINNNAGMPGGTPTASSTSYDINADKGTGFTPALTSGDLNLPFPSSSSGFIEAQALFSNSPVTLQNVGDYVDFILEFTDTANLGNPGGQGNQLNIGLYDAGATNGNGSTPIAPLPGNLATLTTASGGAQGWSGYYSQIVNANGGTASKLWYRPVQNTGTGSQTLTVNTGSVSGGFGTPGPVAVQLVNGSKASTLLMNNGSLYTEDFRITMSAAGVLTVSNEVFAGLGTGGALDYAFGGYTNATDFSFDGLAFSYVNKQSLVMTQDISLVEISTNVPEPSTWMLLASGLALMVGLIARRRRS
jgi:hypothetical protein